MTSVTNTFNETLLDAELARDEGVRFVPYTDTTGHLTAGIGRNLSAVAFSVDEIQLMYANDKARTLAWLDANITYWRTLSDCRQRVLINMAFDLRGTLLQFVHFLAALKSGNYVTCAAEMKNSLWYSQVGQRGVRLAYMMLQDAVMPGNI